MPARTVATALDSLPAALGKIFDQAQHSVANHYKNVVSLHKLQLQVAAVTESVQGGKSVKLVGERAFEETFVDMVNHILSVKKGIALADRIVKFVGGYVKYLNEKGEYQYP